MPVLCPNYVFNDQMISLIKDTEELYDAHKNSQNTFFIFTGINGFLFGNLKHLNMYLDETVEWYLISVGEEVDIHTVHFHGQSVIYQQYSQHRIDVIEMFPGRRFCDGFIIGKIIRTAGGSYRKP